MREFLLLRLRNYYQESGEQISENKDLWIKIVEFYNRFTFSVTPEQIEILLKESAEFYKFIDRV
jgi:hypothetical protein